MLTIVALVVVALAAALVAFVATRPTAFRVARTIAIDATPEAVYAHIADFRAWAAWNPFEREDPAITKTFEGQRRGVGARYHYVGRRAGEGRMTIVEAVPGERIVIRAEFIRPIAATNRIALAIVPTADGVALTWAVSGTNGFAAKALGVVVNMDRIVGGAFEQGLAELTALAEADVRSASRARAVAGR